MYLIAKRITDFTAALLLTLVVFPLGLLIGLVVFVESGSPILFRQERVGKEGHAFRIYKFRTMVASPTAGATTGFGDSVKWPDGVPDDFMFKSSSDARVTRVGRFLRKYSLDELPQLLNVLNGTMSLVGPRPEIPEIARHYNARQARRLTVTPGMTGLAQISGRGELSHGDKIRLDLEYVNRASFFFDIWVLWRTARQVLVGRGAW